jgi:hypothetical protein
LVLPAPSILPLVPNLCLFFFLLWVSASIAISCWMRSLRRQLC